MLRMRTAYRHIVLGTFLSAGVAVAQGPATWTKAIIVDGDTVPTYLLPDHRVEVRVTGKHRKHVEQMDRLTRNVVKVYPYARITADLLAEYERDLAALEHTKDKNLYTKVAEAELRAEFEEEIKGLTMSQGRVLVKLIDRETGHTGYELVKELRGGFQAWMWQGVAKMFGNDLKTGYDANKEDAVIEAVVRRIQNGELAVVPRSARTEKAQAKLDKRKERIYKRYKVAQPMVAGNQ